MGRVAGTLPEESSLFRGVAPSTGVPEIEGMKEGFPWRFLLAAMATPIAPRAGLATAVLAEESLRVPPS